MTGVVRWEEPPPGRRGGRNRPCRDEQWREVARELHEHPQRWAVVLEDVGWNSTGGVASQIKDGRLAAFRPAGSFEAQTRTVAGGYAVYARYVGTGDAS